MAERLVHVVFPLFYGMTHLDVRSDSGLVFTELADLAKVEVCDVLCVPGGAGANAAMLDDAFMREIRRLAGQARYQTSVCTGALILGAAGFDRNTAETAQLQLEYAPAPPFEGGRPENAPAHVTARVRSRLSALLAADKAAVEEAARRLQAA